LHSGHHCGGVRRHVAGTLAMDLIVLPEPWPLVLKIIVSLALFGMVLAFILNARK
jgi:hypothetical protein